MRSVVVHSKQACWTPIQKGEAGTLTGVGGGARCPTPFACGAETLLKQQLASVSRDN